MIDKERSHAEATELGAWIHALRDQEEQGGQRTVPIGCVSETRRGIHMHSDLQASICQ